MPSVSLIIWTKTAWDVLGRPQRGGCQVSVFCLKKRRGGVQFAWSWEKPCRIQEITHFEYFLRFNSCSFSNLPGMAPPEVVLSTWPQNQPGTQSFVTSCYCFSLPNKSVFFIFTIGNGLPSFHVKRAIPWTWTHCCI